MISKEKIHLALIQLGLSIGYMIYWSIYRAISSLPGAIVGAALGGAVVGLCVVVVFRTNNQTGTNNWVTSPMIIIGWSIAFTFGATAIHFIGIYILRVLYGRFYYIISFMVGSAIIGIFGQFVSRRGINGGLKNNHHDNLAWSNKWTQYFVFGSAVGIIFAMIVINIMSKVVLGETMILVSIIAYGLGGAVHGIITGGLITKPRT